MVCGWLDIELLSADCPADQPPLHGPSSPGPNKASAW
jgi:hypothetical protein